MAYVPRSVSCANDSLEGCLGKQTWEDDEEGKEERAEGRHARLSGLFREMGPRDLPHVT